jgi:8-oxo-dGTP pyrophosphatase MutT (NUDIX family)
VVDAPDAVPGPLRERALAYLAGPRETVAPRHAATVVLLRDTREGLEVYLLRRTGSMAFAAGMHVFPGGSVDPRDGDASPAWAGPAPDEWARRLGCDEPLARALVCAAVRETFEESGVLLAGPSTGPSTGPPTGPSTGPPTGPSTGPTGSVVGDTTAEEWEHDRLALLDRSLSMSGLLERRGLVLRSDLLAPFAHWITPEFEPRRFDTRFFAAALPAGQRARDISGEADHATWVGVGAAVRAHEAGQMAMLPPTIEALRDLAAHPDVAAALAAPRQLRPILPRLVETEGGALRLVVE